MFRREFKLGSKRQMLATVTVSSCFNRSPSDAPVSTLASPFAANLVYGISSEGVRLVRAILRAAEICRD
jgi:hypothetical protein